MPLQSPQPLTLQTLLTHEHILLDLDVTSKKRVFEELGFLFERTAGLDHSLVTDSLFARERLGTTGLGYGVAIPHGRVKGGKGLKVPLLAFVQLRAPIGFDAPDGVPVSLLFVLLVPENATQQHLDLLSEIAEVLSDEDRRSSLKTATKADDIVRAIDVGGAR